MQKVETGDFNAKIGHKKFTLVPRHFFCNSSFLQQDSTYKKQSSSKSDKTGGSIANRGFDNQVKMCKNVWKCRPIIVGVVALNTLPHQRTIMATHTEDNIYIKHCKSDASKKVKSSDDHLADQNLYQIFRLDLLTFVPVQQTIQNSYPGSRPTKRNE